MSHYHSLPCVTLLDTGAIEKPEHREALDLDSPALEILTDFREHYPLMLEQSTPVDEAIEVMKRTHVKLKLVIDTMEVFQGVISLADLQSIKVGEAAHTVGVSRKELTVRQVMTPRDALHAVEYSVLTSARIGDLLETMKGFGDQHLLVVDSAKCCIRGMISAAQIARGLHIPIKISERASSFSQIYRAVRG